MENTKLRQELAEARRVQIEPIEESFLKAVTPYDQMVDTRAVPDPRVIQIREIGESCIQTMRERLNHGGNARTMLQFTRVRDTFYELVINIDEEQNVFSCFQLVIWTAEQGRMDGHVMDEWLPVNLCDALWTYFYVTHLVK